MSGNLQNFNFRKIELRLSDSEYYDFWLAQDEKCQPSTSSVSGDTDCLVVHYDFNDPSVFGNSGDTIYSLSTWTGATNTGYTIDTIGLTGIDNGLITFDKDETDYNNKALYSALTESILEIPENDNRLTLNRVTGMTGDIIYPISQSNVAGVGGVLDFCGGFYQGYYKLDGISYEVLPNRYEDEWSVEMWLNKSDSLCSGSTSGMTGVTLNELYPENKGIFFYWGTRSENKFWNEFMGLNTGDTCNSGSTEWCTPIKEDEAYITDDKSGFLIPLDPPMVEITEIDNQFLIYGRACGPSTSSSTSGTTGGSCNGCGSNSCTGCQNKKEDVLGTKTVCNFTGGTVFVENFGEAREFPTNPFLLYGRACKKNTSNSCNCNMCKPNDDNYGTETVCSYNPPTSDSDKELDWAADVVDNGLAFMVKDDGSIGYRQLTVTGYCSGDTYVSGCSIQEEFSASGCVKEDEWTHVAVRWVPYGELEGCELITDKPRKGRLMFYVNCRLKHIIEDFEEFIPKRLNEHWQKQVGVPYNISLGGGSQGLLESMTFDGQDPDDLGLCIENTFAGTFIGQISQFRLNMCGLNWCELKANCSAECKRYDTCYNCKKKNNCCS